MLLGTLFVLAADQITKLAIVARFQEKQTLTLIENLFALTYVKNDGAAFGIFSGYSIHFFLGISALAIGFILYFFWTLESDRIILASALALILGGAMGNLLDRVRLGYVIDFLDLHHKFTIIPFNFDWPKFNVADITILIGVGLFLWDMIQQEKLRLESEKKASG